MKPMKGGGRLLRKRRRKARPVTIWRNGAQTAEMRRRSVGGGRRRKISSRRSARRPSVMEAHGRAIFQAVSRRWFGGEDGVGAGDRDGVEKMDGERARWWSLAPTAGRRGRA